ncbi:Dehydroquinate synthase-like protein [Acaromyces ingoldii]|uniref:Dehydroquinate synthase-like protein n=1 Tax=Acaromyces ingoldii TaxID=215250 RepID=A0A316YSP6_9BASI|nr:Dehydroquinate synthase-like protein [Acaromyces ingoldii]PWN92570.1 Dehydroquinate synthase-like protein [Acaromyces ingoldii]
MRPFVYAVAASRVVFGRGSLKAQLEGEVAQLGAKRVLVITTPHQRDIGEEVSSLLGARFTALYSNATMHTPVEVTEDALKVVSEKNIDCLVAVGGGSTIGLAKALAYRTDLLQIVVPSTYAGSEATSILGQTEKGAKTTLVSPKVLPEVIVYDVDLTLTLPKVMSLTSGVNAIAHSIETLYSAKSNPFIDLLAVEGIQVMMRSLAKLGSEPDDIEARSDALYAAWACGMCLGNGGGTALHHKICHTIGGMLNTPHAETHAIVLPHALQYNYAYLNKDSRRNLGRAFGLAVNEEGGRDQLEREGVEMAQKIFDIVQNGGAPTSLAALGVKSSDLEPVAEAAAKAPYPNPAPLEGPRLLELLHRAHLGSRPVPGL